MDMSHIGNIVLLFIPMPNGRKLPSLLYKKDGLLDTTMTNNKINNKMETNVGFFLINSGFI
jgi:hypothetical protein